MENLKQIFPVLEKAKFVISVSQFLHFQMKFTNLPTNQQNCAGRKEKLGSENAGIRREIFAEELQVWISASQERANFRQRNLLQR
jgi:hypothetical protein